MRAFGVIHDLFKPTVTFSEVIPGIESATSPDSFTRFLAKKENTKALLTDTVSIYNSESEGNPSITPAHSRLLGHKDNIIISVHDKLQFAEFDPVLGKFTAYQAEPKPGGGYKLIVNPEACIHCHGQSWRPIWGGYALWPGAIGGLDDGELGARRKPKGEEANNPANRDDIFKTFSPKIPELAIAKSIRERKNGIYEHVSRSPLSKPSGFYEQFQRHGRNPHLPNLRMNIHLAQFQQVAIYRELTLQPHYEDYKYALYAAFVRKCEDYRAFFPTTLLTKIEKNIRESNPRFKDSEKSVLALLEEDTRRVNDREFDSRLMRYNTLNGTSLTNTDVDNFDSGRESVPARLRYLQEGRGFSINEWAYSREPGGYSYNFSAGIPDKTLENLASWIQKDIELTDPDLNLRDCEEFSRRSRAAIDSIAGVPAKKSAVPRAKGSSPLEHQKIERKDRRY